MKFLRKNGYDDDTIGGLQLPFEKNDIDSLKKYGYKIDTSTTATFSHSLITAKHTSTRLNSKLKMKLNQVNNFNQRAKEQKEQSEVTLDEMLTAISMEVGFQLPDSITLAQYNAYAKRVRKRNDALEMAHKKPRGNVRT
jgi:hypothetical protein